MKKIWLLLWLSLVGISVFAAEDTITEQAEQFYAAGNYEEAADIYRQILDGSRRICIIIWEIVIINQEIIPGLS